MEKHAIRDMALENFCAMARSMGKTEQEIQAAKAECIRTGSDKPFQELIMPGMMAQLGSLFR